MDIKLTRVNDNKFEIVPGSRHRQFFSPHAYRCIPLATANLLGWDIILPEDIEVIWNGGEEVSDVAVTKGQTICESHFGLGTITFTCGYEWETQPGWQLLINPVPNPDFTDIMCMTALVETDILRYPWFITSRIMVKDKVILMPVGTPLCRVIPIQVEPLKSTEIYFVKEREENQTKRNEISSKRKKLLEEGEGKWTKIYQEKAKYVSLKMKKVEVREQDMYGSQPHHYAPQKSEDYSRKVEGDDAAKFLVDNGILCIENFFNDEDIATSMKLWDELGEAVPSEGQWDRRTKWMLGAPIDDNLILKFDQWLQILTHFYGFPVQCIQDLHMTVWYPGDKMDPHDDVCGTLFPTRQYASLVYLSDFQGGELVLPNLGIMLKPEKGMLIAFKGSEVIHGVQPVTGGERMTINGWFDDKIHYRDNNYIK